MKSHHFSGITLLVLLIVALIATPRPALGCAPAWPPNKPVQIANESAIIIWSADTKTEHFIRRASFETKADDFGFLVPTPTRPTLAEASDDAFSQLAKLTAPVVVEQPRPSNPGCGIGCGAAPSRSPGEAAVAVLEEKHVAGYDAAVLAADNADSLGTWLKEHGYEFSPELIEWAGIYARQGWIVTAFKVSKAEAESPRAATAAVRMSFTTDRPFFPYREPNRAAPAISDHSDRLLRIYFIGDKRMEGTLGDKGEAWKGKVVWSNKMNVGYKALLKAVGLPEEEGSLTPWLTEFEDHSSPRVSGADLFFAPSAKQDTLAREPYIRYTSNWSDGIMTYATVVCLVTPVMVRRFRRTQGTTSAPGMPA